MAMHLVLAALAVFDSCPWECAGTALERVGVAHAQVASIDLSSEWSAVRQHIVRACGLRVESSTSHCFEDFNHVDCCAMAAENTFRTNQASKVPGMHPVNLLGPHITAASVESHGEGGSWCTCQLNSPLDVCHKQFGASTAFKLIWCEGRQVAAITDDSGNLLNWGRPKGAQVPAYGASTARAQNWGVLANSPNGTMANRWQAACDQAVQNVKAGFKPTSLSGVAP
ncbi:MAG: hypothetical protein SGPRY_005383 [Prymnesium sp.]